MIFVHRGVLFHMIPKQRFFIKTVEKDALKPWMAIAPKEGKFADDVDFVPKYTDVSINFYIHLVFISWKHLLYLIDHSV